MRKKLNAILSGYPLRQLLFAGIAVLFALSGTDSWAGVELLPETEFRALARDCAPKVALFHDAWEKDPTAEFYGGTSRDFLYWLKGKFSGARTRPEAEKIAAQLRALPAIDVREFIIGDSDVDIVTSKSQALVASDYGVRKIDYQSPEIFDPRTESGFNERHQGFAPAEKIRLGRGGLLPNSGLGDGASEIYSGKVTVHFASEADFALTKYAKDGINHPVLLAIRYLRLQAMNYFRIHGSAHPDRVRLLALMDPSSTAEVRKVLARAASTSELQPFLERDKFRSWLNGVIQKAFRSYTNPTAALELMKEFEVDALVAAYPQQLEPINQYVFTKHRDSHAIEENLRKAGVRAENLYTSVAAEFHDGFLYHGTKDEGAFRNILFQGIIPSAEGSGGAGLYGVGAGNKAFAESWGQKQLLLKFPVKSDAKIIDITKGPGKVLWDAALLRSLDHESFAETYGADILKYPYTSEAYVVKNSAALGRGAGVYQELLPLGEILERSKHMREPGAFLSLIRLNKLSTKEALLVLNSSAVPDVERAFLRTAIEKGLYGMDFYRWWLKQDEAGKTVYRDITLAAGEALSQADPFWVREFLLHGLQGGFSRELLLPMGMTLAKATPQEIAVVLSQETSRAYPEWVWEFIRTKPFEPFSGNAPLKKIFGAAHWITHPQMDSWMKFFIDRGNGDQLLNLILGKKGYPTHPSWEKWVSASLAKSQSETNPSYSYVAGVLSSEETSKRADWASRVGKVLEEFSSERPHSAVLVRLSESLMTAEFARKHPEWHGWAMRLMRNPVSYYGEVILKKSWSAQYPEFMEALLPQVLQAGATKPEVLETFNREILGLGHWSAHPALRAACAGAEPTVACLTAALKKGGHFRVPSAHPVTCASRFSGIVGQSR